jgi:hypothetical protein
MGLLNVMRAMAVFLEKVGWVVRNYRTGNKGGSVGALARSIAPDP